MGVNAPIIDCCPIFILPISKGPTFRKFSEGVARGGGDASARYKNKLMRGNMREKRFMHSKKSKNKFLH